MLTPNSGGLVMSAVRRPRSSALDPFLVNNLIIPIAGMITGVVVSIGFFRTVRHAIDRKASGSVDAGLTTEIAELHARIDALEHRSDRVDELEDRIDFAERLLARASESGASVREP